MINHREEAKRNQGKLGRGSEADLMRRWLDLHLLHTCAYCVLLRLEVWQGHHILAIASSAVPVRWVWRSWSSIGFTADLFVIYPLPARLFGYLVERIGRSLRSSSVKPTKYVPLT